MEYLPDSVSGGPGSICPSRVPMYTRPLQLAIAVAKFVLTSGVIAWDISSYSKVVLSNSPIQTTTCEQKQKAPVVVCNANT